MYTHFSLLDTNKSDLKKLQEKGWVWTLIRSCLVFLHFTMLSSSSRCSSWPSWPPGGFLMGKKINQIWTKSHLLSERTVHDPQTWAGCSFQSRCWQLFWIRSSNRCSFQAKIPHGQPGFFRRCGNSWKCKKQNKTNSFRSYGADQITRTDPYCY